ncbi:hypothetical protein [Richelia sinica]|uniref:hypothetical protein n=1 Tax=Richelia sinica TaxID=1357545 RepID=UPI001687917D|nr:hypothetical protein [Richelia sinica]MBD2665553.1 hypothetical protein [Richelia sinica FACHB-800]
MDYQLLRLLISELIKTRATSVKSEISADELNRPFHHLTLEEMETISGGNTIIPLWNSQRQIICDGFNSFADTYLNSLGFYDNKILTIDFSQTNVYLVF